MYDVSGVPVIFGGLEWSVTGRQVFSGGQFWSSLPELFFLFPLCGMVGWSERVSRLVRECFHSKSDSVGKLKCVGK